MSDKDPRRQDREREGHEDPGAYIGNKPERATETIPGGLTDADERVAAHSTRPGPPTGEREPGGHRDGPPASDDAVREAGQDR